MPDGALLVGAPRQDPVCDELVQAVAEDVARDAGVPLDPVEATLADERLAEDEDGVAVADQLERGGDGAVVAIPVGEAHARRVQG